MDGGKGDVSLAGGQMIHDKFAQRADLWGQRGRGRAGAGGRDGEKINQSQYGHGSHGPASGSLREDRGGAGLTAGRRDDRRLVQAN